jgi:hypothetical protein
LTRQDAGETLNPQHKEFTPLRAGYGKPTPNGERFIPVADIEKPAERLIGSAEIRVHLAVSVK